MSRYVSAGPLADQPLSGSSPFFYLILSYLSHLIRELSPSHLDLDNDAIDYDLACHQLQPLPPPKLMVIRMEMMVV